MDFVTIIAIVAFFAVSLGFARVFYSIFSMMAICIFRPHEVIEARINYLRTRLEEAEG